MPLTVGKWIARSSTGDWWHPQRCEMGWFRLTFDFWFWFIFGKISFDPRTILVWEWDSFGRHRKNTCCVSFRATRPYAKDMIYTVSLTSKHLTPSTKKTVICKILLKMRFKVLLKLCDFDNSFEGTVRQLSGFKQMQDIEESTANIGTIVLLGSCFGRKKDIQSFPCKYLLWVCLQPGWSCCVVDDFYSISSMREVSSVLVGQYRPTIAVFCVLHLGSQEQLLLTPKNSGLEKNGWLW